MNELPVFLLPVVFIAAMIAFTAIFAGAVYFILKPHLIGGKPRMSLFQEFAKNRSLNFLGDNTFAIVRGYEYFRLFNLGTSYGRRIENLVSGEMNGFQVMIFDSVYYISKKFVKQTVYMFHSPKMNLPLFSFQPKKDSFSKWFAKISPGGSEITLGENFFNKHEIVGQNENWLEQTFTPQILSYLKTIEGINVEGGGNRIFFYSHGRLSPLQELDQRTNEGIRMARLFQR